MLYESCQRLAGEQRFAKASVIQRVFERSLGKVNE